MRTSIVSLAVLTMTCQFVFAETAEDVIKKVNQLRSQHKTVQYTMNMVVELKQAGFELKATTTSEIHYMRIDDGYLMRNETTGVRETNREGVSDKSQTKTTQVIDGKYYWQYAEGEMTGAKRKRVVKDRIPPFGDPLSTDSYKRHDLKLLPEETIEGKEVWVLEIVPKKSGSKATGSKTKEWIDRETGLTLKAITYNALGKIQSRVMFSDHKINEKIDQSVFEFEPPADAQVTDNTKR